MSWHYEYGGVQKRSIWSKAKLVFNTLWLLLFVLVCLTYDLFKGKK